MIPTKGNNDLTGGKNEIFFALALDAGSDGPILLTTAVANRGYPLHLANCCLPAVFKVKRIRRECRAVEK
ncbi:hypothetical protein [Serratia oryzae]|uniref:hypothetical protein n=1 Tax=Serratia oryzae TaxID=2034155 RepID=UPI000F7A9C85|nr:hypothetical protein [Serratia oryzae]